MPFHPALGALEKRNTEKKNCSSPTSRNLRIFGKVRTPKAPSSCSFPYHLGSRACFTLALWMEKGIFAVKEGVFKIK